MTAFSEPVTLSGRHAALEPLSCGHHDALAEAVRDADGSLRDTVVFSIIAQEWPAVKRHLLFKLAGD